MSDDRRYPASLQGLLKFCTENTQAEDGTRESQFEPMSEEVYFTVSLIYQILDNSFTNRERSG